LSSSAAFHYEDFSVGGDIKYELEDKRRVRDYNFGAAYKFQDLSVIAQVEKSLSIAKLGVLHKVNKNTSLAYQFSHELCDSKKDSFEVTAGFGHQIDSDSSVKANLQMAGVATVAYKVKVKPEVTFTISLENSVKEISGNGKIGFAISYEPTD